MQYHWLNNKNNKKLIVFFNGWGMDYNAISHLDWHDFDIVEIGNYIYFNFDFDFLSNYSEKYLIAWSMGVMVSSLFYDILNSFDKKIALSGTPKMIDDNYGIPKRIYDLTIRGFNSKSAELFSKNMFKGIDNFIKPERDTEELKKELIALKNIKIEKELDFNKAIIPENDIIVPTKNQLNYWNNKNIDIKIIKSPHYPFSAFKNIEEIIC